MKTYKRICLLVLACLLIAAPVVLLAGIGVMRGSGAVFGYRFLNVLSSSMEPAIKQGDMIVVRSCAPERVRVGDDITYAAHGFEQDVLITHRVVDILTEQNGEQGLWFVAKGLNNNYADPPFQASQLVGKVVMRLPGLGAVIQWMGGHPAISLVAAVLLLLLCLPVAALLVWLATRRRRKNETFPCYPPAPVI